MNVAELLVKLAESLGIEQCFTVTGGMAMHLNFQLNESKRITSTFTHHEQAAICAAEGYSKANNFQIPGMACVTAGPGVSNSITGLLASFGDSVPLFILAGQVKQSDIGNLNLRTHGIQEIRTELIIPPCVKLFVSLSPEKLQNQLTEVVRAFYKGRKGPVFVEVPLDVQQYEVSSDLLSMILNEIDFQKSQIAIEEFNTLREELEILSKSARLKVGLYIGNGLRISGANTDNLRALCKRKGIPRFYTWLSFDMDDYDEPSNFGCPGSFAPISSNVALQSCDVVIFLGARLDLATTAFQRTDFGARGKRVLVDIDRFELDKFTNPDDIKICADLASALGIICTFLENINLDVAWSEKLVEQKKQYIIEESNRLGSDEVTIREIALHVSEYASNSILVSASSGIAEETFTRFLRPNGKFRFFNSGALGAMGQGLSHGIGAALARKEADIPVYVFEGDGGLWMNIHELATVKAANLKNFHLVILNNQGYGSIVLSQKNHFDYKYGCDSESGLVLPAWEQVAKLFDFMYLEINSKEDLARWELTDTHPYMMPKIVNIHIPLNEPKGPKLKTIFTDSGPVTQRLGELSW